MGKKNALSFYLGHFPLINKAYRFSLVRVEILQGGDVPELTS